MTDIEALKKTVALWKWLARHPDRGKKDAYAVLHFATDHNFCPLCENVWNKGGCSWKIGVPECIKCLLRDFWPDQDCCDTDSDFTKWRRAKTKKERTYHAQEISYAARLKLQSLNKETEKL